MQNNYICICTHLPVQTLSWQVWYRRGCVLQLYMYTSTYTDTVLRGLISPELCSTIIYVYYYVDIFYLYRHCPERSDIAGAVFYNYLCKLLCRYLLHVQTLTWEVWYRRGCVLQLFLYTIMKTSSHKLHIQTLSWEVWYHRGCVLQLYTGQNF